MYEVLVVLGEKIICEVRLKTITQVCKFLETVDFELVFVDVYSPKHKLIDAKMLLEVWNA